MKKVQSMQQAGGKTAPAVSGKAQWIAENLKPGELYAGLILGKSGQPDYHLVLLPGKAESVNWEAAKAFAIEAGGELPTRREQAMLYANLKEEFEPNWYWSGEQHAAHDSYAWVQFFYYGGQTSNVQSASLRARAVRRLTIQ